MSDKDHPTTEYDDYGSENNYDTGYDDGIESDGYTSEDYESGEYESDDNKTGDYASDDYDAEYSDSDSYASDDYDAEDGDPEYYDSEQYAASDYDDTYDQGEYDVESADPATIDPDTIPPEALEPYYDKSAFKWLKNMNRAKLIRLVSMLIFSVAILVFASIAWFTMNKGVGTSGMSVKTATMPFEIAVKGSTVRNDTEFIKADNAYTYGDDEIISGYNLTGSSDTQIKMRYTPSAEEETDFGPGSSGIIEFYVVPKRDGDLTVKIDLDVIGFRELGETDTTIKRVSELTVANSGLEQSVIDQYQEAENYLKGHIMFFEEEGDTDENTLENQRYYYAKPITNKTINRTFLNASKNVPQKVTVYWMWTNTLGQIALRNNTTGYRSDYPVVKDVSNESSDISSTDKGKVIQYLKDNKNLVFTNYSEITDAIIDDANNAEDKTSFKKLSDGYNDADFLIGSGLSYFLVDISVGLAN